MSICVNYKCSCRTHSLEPLDKDWREELKKQVSVIIESPVRSQLQTADIRVGMWSSTGLQEKVFDITELVSKTIASQKSQWIEKLPKRKKKSIELMESVIDQESYIQGFNQALSEVLEMLKDDK